MPAAAAQQIINFDGTKGKSARPFVLDLRNPTTAPIPKCTRKTSPAGITLASGQGRKCVVGPRFSVARYAGLRVIVKK